MHEGNNMGITTTLKKPTLERRPPGVRATFTLSPILGASGETIPLQQTRVGDRRQAYLGFP